VPDQACDPGWPSPLADANVEVEHLLARPQRLAHGGCITVESQLGAGSTFRVELPLEASARCGGDAAAGGGQAAGEADAPAMGSPLAG
jgi:hypothetical protein